METIIANSSYFDGMEHSSTMGSRDVSRDFNPFGGDLDPAAYITSSNYKQTPMMSTSSAILRFGRSCFIMNSEKGLA